jgi:hypothetical protein
MEYPDFEVEFMENKPESTEAMPKAPEGKRESVLYVIEFGKTTRYI